MNWTHVLWDEWHSINLFHLNGIETNSWFCALVFRAVFMLYVYIWSVVSVDSIRSALGFQHILLLQLLWRRRLLRPPTCGCEPPLPLPPYRPELNSLSTCFIYCILRWEHFHCARMCLIAIHMRLSIFLLATWFLLESVWPLWTPYIWSPESHTLATSQPLTGSCSSSRPLDVGRAWALGTPPTFTS